MATPSDLNQLLEMGFEKQRAEIAVKKSGGCTLLSGLDLTPLQMLIF
jgi:hypothetical protein